MKDATSCASLMDRPSFLYCWKRVPTSMPKMMMDGHHFIVLAHVDMRPSFHLLLEKGANVDAKDEGEDTPLHLASREGHEAVIALLLEKGTDVNVKDKGGLTPLHYASKLWTRGSRFIIVGKWCRRQCQR